MRTSTQGSRLRPSSWERTAANTSLVVCGLQATPKELEPEDSGRALQARRFFLFFGSNLFGGRGCIQRGREQGLYMLHIHTKSVFKRLAGGRTQEGGAWNAATYSHQKCRLLLQEVEPKKEELGTPPLYVAPEKVWIWPLQTSLFARRMAGRLGI